MKRTAILFAVALIASTAFAQTKAPLPPLPAPQSIPKPAADTGQPYAPQAILPGGIVVPLFPPSSPYLKADKIHVPEVYSMSQTVHGRISSIVSIHNPSIEVHMVEKSINTGTAVIVIAGGGHRTLNVGGESADFVPFFYNYGINTIILRNRLRADGYVAEVDAVHDAQQAVRVVRAYAKEWGIDPKQDRRHGLLCRRRARRSSRRSLRRLGQEEQRSLRPVRRHFLAAGLRRYHLPRPDAVRPQPHRAAQSRKTFRPRFSSVAAPVTESTPSGLSSITRRCSRLVSPMWKCTSTATAATPATRCRTGAACPAA